MSSFGGGIGGRTRVGTKVLLNVYDLSPANQYLYAIGCGLHHSGVEILGSEYSFASGAGIFSNTPKTAPNASFREQIVIGTFDGGSYELRQALQSLEDDFQPDSYNLIRKNCNHFANALCWKLLRQTIPSHINRLADLGVCCSCLLPKNLVDHAPVGDPAYDGSGRPSSSSLNITPFSGTGSRLGGAEFTPTTDASGSERQGLLSRTLMPSAGSRTPQQSQRDDLKDRREKAKKAALARLEKQRQESKQSQ